MSTSNCRHQERILDAARQRSLSTGSRSHLETCTSCAMALQIDRLLWQEAHRAPALADLPEPTLIWWRSRQRARIRQTERATRPIQWAERVALALGGLGLAVGSSLVWPTLGPLLAAWWSDWSTGLGSAIPMGPASWILALCGSLVLLAGFGLYVQWTES